LYAKIFNSLFDGSMRGHSNLILVFVNLLCHADEDGIIDRHWRAIADETGLDEQTVRQAITELESPDPDSRTRTNEGRRLTRIDPEREWGWQIVNFQHYRNLRTAEERREYMRNYMANKRCKQSVNTCKQNVSTLANTETETETETKAKKDILSNDVDNHRLSKTVKDNIKTPVSQDFEEVWKAYPDKSGKYAAEIDYIKAAKQGTLKADVLAGIDRYKKYVEYQRGHGQPDLKWKNGSTFFHQRGWTSEYTIQTGFAKKLSNRDRHDADLRACLAAIEKTPIHDENFRDKLADIYGKIADEAWEIIKFREKEGR